MKLLLNSKKFLALAGLLLLLLPFTFAQVPTGMNYQAVVRDGQQVLANQVMGVEFSVYQDSAEVYKESQILTSNEFGLIHAIVGEGNTINGALDSLDWNSGSYKLKVSIDAGGGFEELGEMALTSVPFSRQAERSNFAETSRFSEEATSLENHNIFTDNGNVGIGVTPTTDFTVKGYFDALDPIAGFRGTRIYGWGGAEFRGDNGKRNVLISYASTTNRNNGYIGVYNDNGDHRGSLQVNSAGAGGITLKGANGNDNTVTGYTGSAGNHGYFAARDVAGTTRANLYAKSSTNSGVVVTYGTNGNSNVVMAGVTGNENHGFVTVRDAGGNEEAGIYVNSSGNGVVFGDIKNFRMEHPTQPGKEIWYACIEGPEAAAYERGTAKLINGKAVVDFSDHFKLVSSTKGMTVILTPLSGSSEGLAVINKTETGFEVNELRNGTGSYEFDWEVKVIRKGFEDYQVIRDAIDSRPGTEFQTLEEIETP